MFWSLKDIKRLLNFIEALNLTIPPDASDPHWKEIDKFTRKPGKMQIINFCLTNLDDCFDISWMFNPSLPSIAAYLLGRVFKAEVRLVVAAADEIFGSLATT